VSKTFEINSLPLVSIVLPVYNGGDHLKEAIESILGQTYSNFEFIILNDGSTDDSEKVILSYRDKRIRYAKHKNCGLAGTLNRGLEMSAGKYIARQDQDDISYKDRISKQVEFLEKNESILLLGTHARIFFDDSKKYKVHDHSTRPSLLKFDLMFDNPFVHSTVMFRRKDIETIGFYNTDRSYYEDYELWSRFSAKGNVANLNEVLLDYRHHAQGLSKSVSYFKEDAVYRQSLDNIQTLMGEMKDTYNDLSALFHWHPEKCKGVSKAELNAGLAEIADRIAEIYPEDKAGIKKRLRQYKKIIGYRINMIARNGLKKNSLKMLILRAENKLKGLQPHVIN
jgi:glycosyltransferase involved in cell wall biosynthesis